MIFAILNEVDEVLDSFFDMVFRWRREWARRAQEPRRDEIVCPHVDIVGHFIEEERELDELRRMMFFCFIDERLHTGDAGVAFSAKDFGCSLIIFDGLLIFEIFCVWQDDVEIAHCAVEIVSRNRLLEDFELCFIGLESRFVARHGGNGDGIDEAKSDRFFRRKVFHHL